MFPKCSAKKQCSSDVIFTKNVAASFITSLSLSLVGVKKALYKRRRRRRRKTKKKKIWNNENKFLDDIDLVLLCFCRKKNIRNVSLGMAKLVVVVGYSVMESIQRIAHQPNDHHNRYYQQQQQV